MNLIESLRHYLRPPAFALTVFVFVAAIALLACWLPAHRAALTDPVEAVRHE